MLHRFVVIVAGALVAASAFAQQVPTAGKEYFELNPPQATDSPGKVEVLEFFWYRCPHCYSLEPQLEPWVKRLPKDAQFKRMPAIFNDDWAVDARIFFTLEAMGQVERLHKLLFNAIHQQGGVRLKGDAYAQWVADWLSKQNVDMKKYDETYRSFTVTTRLRRASQMTQAYRLEGVPALAIQGRYVVNASPSMLAVADHLIGQARRQAPAKQ